ncbi:MULTISPECIES: alpha/beta fold hydrolase [unclassified Leeuwenhoekiella]|uniref:alpha/beta fold hydrolase n=1 Tax=unclassified Leeuwenhoekiella TaxID=2615029 RepID=UPI000C3EEAC9|nr:MULTISPECIES: alpha/beta fold hydrolase [unclassified Leeuwenhoekiella]MAW96399.1 alpha/beta hydrolase [Leeuwenhoekiella sp.]MBA81286.1 alpha/beta hydrolase [Leeuwenhoekiella sp.]|tara:strand:- start:31508 stop:32284 length:777 start_codon:yes stop_codon:yes gene_type:complete
MSLHSSITGEGKAFVILHGFLGMGDNWKTMANQFADAGYEVHLVDQRNHGRSFHSEVFNYDVLAADLKEYCDEHNLSDIILMGHSMGGKTAMFFAMQFPELLDKLIIADIGPKYYAPHHQEILDGLKALSENDSARKSRGDADEFLSSHIKDWGTRQFLLKNLYWQKDKTLALRVNLPVLTREVEAIGQALPTQTIYEGDVLFLNGLKSNYITPEDSALIGAHFPNSQITGIKDAGHWLHAENPEDFYAEVMRFLGKD